MKKIKEWANEEANKKDVAIIFIISVLFGLLLVLVLLDISKRDLGSLADWISALATFSAVIVALLPLLKKRKPSVYFLQKRHESSNILFYETIAFTNASDVAGFFELCYCRWKGKNGRWHKYFAKYFLTNFSVMPFQGETEMENQSKALPDDYAPPVEPKKENPNTGTPILEKIDWVEAELVYIDIKTGAKAILRFTCDSSKKICVIH